MQIHAQFRQPLERLLVCLGGYASVTATWLHFQKQFPPFFTLENTQRAVYQWIHLHMLVWVPDPLQQPLARRMLVAALKLVASWELLQHQYHHPQYIPIELYTQVVGDITHLLRRYPQLKALLHCEDTSATGIELGELLLWARAMEIMGMQRMQDDVREFLAAYEVTLGIWVRSDALCAEERASLRQQSVRGHVNMFVAALMGGLRTQSTFPYRTSSDVDRTHNMKSELGDVHSYVGYLQRRSLVYHRAITGKLPQFLVLMGEKATDAMPIMPNPNPTPAVVPIGEEDDGTGTAAEMLLLLGKPSAPEALFAQPDDVDSLMLPPDNGSFLNMVWELPTYWSQDHDATETAFDYLV